MFIFDTNATPQAITWPVTVKLPRDGGDYAELNFSASFKRIPEDEYLALLERHKATDDTFAAQQRANAGIFSELMTGWTGVVAPDQTPITYSDGLLRTLLTGTDGMHISNGLYQAYNEIRLGGRQKN